ncbi:MAG: flagellar motor protein MotB [Mesorhizobium sp.]|uniref:OmpA family protein n=2 Tax=Mesorhizobium TaxID=68287 RepID=UPI000FEA0C3B|nr:MULTISPECIES: OmpA family protein [unclassified Mesorhizobium]MDF3178906.1 OmpA family protein [Mesorhizobium sp. P17.1]RWG58237.1 MAG: flagellar motor protein MotB [Mesorhizobium sp.]RWI32211.1 MAG: flagellar motor protein MotB [Mesorhizobium sp.]RWI52069.1 MAG: flagellar motor protein MotB [Mesorhizobium sp.]TIM77692.1 MAG: flagellar motor protein MotB [Mesorhizobium sp.]
MKRQPRILAGTAIGLLMASAPLGAYPLQADLGPSRGTPFILAQSNCAEGQSAEECAQGQQGQAEQPRKKKREQQTESAPAEQSAEPEQKPRRKRQDQQQSGQAEEAAPAEQQLKPRKKRDQQQQIEAAPADQGGQAATDEQQPRKKKRQQQTETAPAEQPAEQAAPASDEQQPRRKKRQQQQTETAPAEQPAEQAAPANDNTPQDKLRRKKRDQQQTETAPAEQAPKTEAPAGEAQQAEPQQDNQQAAPAEGEQPSDKTKRRKMVGEQPGTGQAVTGEQPSTQQPSSEGQATSQPATGEQPAEGGANAGAAAQGEAPANANEAPILDSQKDVVRKRKGRQPAGQNENGQAGVEQGGNQAGQQGGNQAEQRPAAVDQGPPPTDDKAAQQAIKPEKLVPVTEEKGKRIELTPEQVVRERRRPQGADVVKQFGDRVILQFNNQTFVESNEAPRITRGARDVYYEDLPRGRTRETVERENGVKIVTIRNRNGDIVQRSRITPDGREYVLSYVDERYYQDVDDWRDPGDDLPPMRLDISRRDYILDSEEVEDPDEYYTFLEQPPVERVQRLYSIDEVKRSARVRDIARRIDLDTLNFDFGSATLSDTEVQKLEGVATAMDKLLKKNPAETFLIEGHTDAVGTPDANLALSDRRAEAVAEALTNAFGVPAENLTTQGYGEEYLKVNTSSPNRENRRVAIRRITSLVAPVASNEQ